MAIQIFTRSPKKLSADLGLGSYQRIGGNLGFGIGDEDEVKDHLQSFDRDTEDCIVMTVK